MAEENSGAPQVRMSVLAQFVRDLSFENMYDGFTLFHQFHVEGLRFVRVQYTTTNGTVEVMLTVCGVLNG